MRAVALLLLIAGCSANDDIPAPLVSTITPDHGPVGSIVVVSGSYFCQRPAGSDDLTCNVTGTVDFGASPGTPSSWTDTAIMVEVPSGVTGVVDVAVTATGRTSNSISFTAE